MDEMIRGRRRCSGAKMRFLRDFSLDPDQKPGCFRTDNALKARAAGVPSANPGFGRPSKKRTLADLAPNGGHHLQIELNVHTSGK
jgi:hypothetical protein